MDFDLAYMALSAVPIIWALTMHEYMHGWSALKCGDDTALRMGRLTLNPLRHLDPLGTLCLFFAGFGWAKPVLVRPDAFRSRRLGHILVSLAGPGSNFILAVSLCLMFRLLGAMDVNAAALDRSVQILLAMAAIAVFINFALAIFNMLPIAPLDGHHIVRELLPAGGLRETFMNISRIGPILLIAFIFVSRSTEEPLLLKPILPLMQLIMGADGLLMFADSVGTI